MVANRNECVEWHFSTDLKTNDSSVFFSLNYFRMKKTQRSSVAIKIDSQILISSFKFCQRFCFQCRPKFTPELFLLGVEFALGHLITRDVHKVQQFRYYDKILVFLF